LERCTKKGKDGKRVKRVGVMGVVEREGYVQPGYVIYAEQPKTWRALRGV